MRCPGCNTEIPDSSVFCLNCGQRLAPTKSATHGSSGAIAQPTNDWLTVREYQLGEKVENRVWESIRRQTKIGVVVFSIAGTLLAFFGGSVLLDYVTSKVKEGLQRDARVLQDKIVAQSADMAIASAQLKIQADAAATEFARINQSAQQLKQLADKFEDLRLRSESNSSRVNALDKVLIARVTQMQKDSEKLGILSAKLDNLAKVTDGLDQKVARAQGIAASAQVSTKSLGGGILTSSLGGPAILGGPSFKLDAGMLTGTNFGKSRGRLYLRVSSNDFVHLLQGSKLKVLEVQPDSIKRWEDGEIEYSLSPDIISYVEKTAKELNADSRPQLSKVLLDSFGAQVEFQIETASGQKSNRYGIYFSLLWVA